MTIHLNRKIKPTQLCLKELQSPMFFPQLIPNVFHNLGAAHPVGLHLDLATHV